ncbi:MAG TPA: hypothetical protein VFW76_09935, partial [Ktedonobacterales bacterium]|nr:hypothetical protein [Ktedonobacterales bacterium]
MKVLHQILRTQSWPMLRPLHRSILVILIVVTAILWAAAPKTATTVHAAGAARSDTLPPGTVVHAAFCEQAPPQSAKDRATYTPAELARYGLPPRMPSQPFDKWAKMVRAAGERVCDYTIGDSQIGVSPSWVLIHNANWAGYVADESYAGQNYTEADMDYYVPCITGAPPDPDNPGTAVMGAWIGLGGNNGVGPLIQAGTLDFQNWDPIHGYQPLYQAFVENTGPDPNNPDPPHYSFTMSCNTQVYVEVWGGNCMWVLDLDNRGLNTQQCYGQPASNQSAEAMVERNLCSCYPYFAHFFDPSSSTSTITFHGVGITDNGGYKAMYQVPHNKDQIYDC